MGRGSDWSRVQAQRGPARARTGGVRGRVDARAARAGAAVAARVGVGGGRAVPEPPARRRAGLHVLGAQRVGRPLRKRHAVRRA